MVCFGLRMQTSFDGFFNQNEHNWVAHNLAVFFNDMLTCKPWQEQQVHILTIELHLIFLRYREHVNIARQLTAHQSGDRVRSLDKSPASVLCLR